MTGVHPGGKNGRAVGTGPVGPAPESAAAAEAAARVSGVEIRELHEVGELHQAFELFGRIWQAGSTDPPISTPVMRALTHTGNYLVGAYDADALVGACIGFLAAPPGRALHSHMAAAAPEARGRGVGFALKAHQRAWALAHGLTTITWTYDPLVARNAYVNVTKLGADPTEYVDDFYGIMGDRINVGDPTDRLVVTWRLDTDRVARCCLGEHDEPDVDALRSAGAAVGLDAPEGWPRPGAVDAPVLLVRVPTDVERLRADDPPLALTWRHALREVLGGLIDGGARVTSFARSGWYVVENAAGTGSQPTGGAHVSEPEEGQRR